ncbi:MAG: c-type cytochrome [Woeseiaceae bacterium]
MVLKQKLSRILALGMGLMMISTWSEPVVAASPGSQLYKKACKKCHGKLGQGRKSKADSSQFKYPPIHEMPEEDLLKAMTKYKEMWQKKTYIKKEKRMAKPAGRLSDEEMKAVVAFITSQLSREGK